jgi:hypothetical protein
MMFVFDELLRNWESQKLKDLNSTITVNLFMLLPRNDSCQEDHVFFVHTVWTSLTHMVWVLCNVCVCVCVGKMKKHLGLFVTLQFKGLVVHRTYFVAVSLVYHELLSVKSCNCQRGWGCFS